MPETTGDLVLAQGQRIPNVTVYLRSVPPSQMREWGGLLRSVQVELEVGGPHMLHLPDGTWKIWIVRIDQTTDGCLALFREAAHRDR